MMENGEFLDWELFFFFFFCALFPLSYGPYLGSQRPNIHYDPLK